MIEKTTFDFLKALARNNDRDWFARNKSRYIESLANVTSWVEALIAEMNKHDEIQTKNGKESLYRIYNDVRFSKDKTPYTARFSGTLKRVKPFLRGGYYFWIKPGASHVGCGFSYPNPEDLKRIREDISVNHEDWNKVLRDKKIVKTFGTMLGDQVKSAPRGFAKDHPGIALLRYKQFWFEKSFTDKEVLSPGFLKDVNSSYKSIRPLFDYMTEVLTTDANGISLL